MPKKYNYDLRDDFHTIEELESLHIRLARIANRRLRELEKAGRDYWGYNVATLYTQRAYGSNRYRVKWSGTKEGLVHELDEIQSFLNMESSTVSGSRKIEQKIVNTFKDKHNIEIKNRQEFFNFLSSATFKSIANNGITSGQVIDYFVRSREEGKSVDEIEEALNEFRKGEIKGIRELYDRADISVFDMRYTENKKR